MTPDYCPGTPQFDRCFSLVIGERASCRLSDALEAPIPAGVKRYLLAEIVALLESDLASSPRLQRLLGGSDPVGRTRSAILQGLAPLYEMTREDFRAMLDAALLFTGRMLIRPLDTVERDLIGGRNSVTLDALRAYFSRTADYGYFPRLAEEVFRRRGICEMRADEFRVLMAKIDDQVVLQHGAQEFALLMKPIFDFVLCRDAGRNDPVPLDPILQFLNDKKMTITREYIESISRLRDLQTITLDQLAGYLGDLHADETPAESEATPPVPPQSQAAPAVIAPEPALEPPAHGIPVLGGPAHGASPLGPPALGPPALGLPGQGAQVSGENGTEDAPLLPDIRKLIGEKERSRFVRHVFKRDQAYFYGVIATLNTFWTWKEASAYLQQVYSVNRLDPFDKDVVAFTDLVHRRYSGGDSSE